LSDGRRIGRTQRGNNNAYCQDNEMKIRGSDVSDILWLRLDGRPMTDDDWRSPATRSLALFLAGQGVDDLDDDGRPIADDDLLLVLHAHPEPRECVLPAFPRGATAWELLLDTSDDEAAGVYSGGAALPMPPRSLKLLRGITPDRKFPGLGAIAGDDGVTFRVWAGGAARVTALLYARAGDAFAAVDEVPLVDTGAGVFEANVPTTPGALYKFRVGEQELPDPYARSLPWGVHGPAEVVASVRVDRGEWRPRPLSQCVIYELHVGTFTPEGTFAAAMARLPELAELGITALEILPVSSFSGRHGWGYDGVAHFAPHAAYGGADDLRALVAAAHALGMNVLLDVVYNHFGPEGNYLGSYHPGYFARDEVTPWGQALNFAAPAMRRYVVDNAIYWLTEYGFDGLRLDATHAMHDRSERRILQEVVAAVRALDGDHILIAEDETCHPDLVLATGLDAFWADDFHHIVHGLLTGERDGYYGEYEVSVAELARCIARGLAFEGEIWTLNGRPRGGPTDALPASAFVLCLQNHDQVGNRALGERLHHLTRLDDYCAVSMLLLFLPMTPLLWMGQEWAASAPWCYFTDHPRELGELVTAGRRAEFSAFAGFRDPASLAAIPDPQALSTFTGSQLRWDERATAPHAGVLALYKSMLWLRREDPVLAAADRGAMEVGAEGDRLWVRRSSPEGRRLLVVDFGAAPDPRPTIPGQWTPLLSADGPGLPAARAVLYAAGPGPSE
jgi:maltooligosyltrehalose trehalohydrolase